MERAMKKHLDDTESHGTEVDAAVEHSGTLDREVCVWSSEAIECRSDTVAQEVAVALVYNGISHAVMMASPTELEAFALGFSLTEGIIDKAEDIFDIDIVEQEKGI